MYKNLINPEWGTLDLVENIEDTIHNVVRLQNPGADPPALQCQRTATNEVMVVYKSKRKFCRLAIGIIKGLAKYYQESISISESSCMLTDDSECKISIIRGL